MANASVRLFTVFTRPWLSTVRGVLSLSISLVFLCSLRAFAGLHGVRAYTIDAFVLLDGAWRMLQGQIPHLHFYTGLGPLAYFPTAAGLAIAGGGVAGFGYGVALAGLLTAVWTFLICRGRFADPVAVICCLLFTLEALCPYIWGLMFNELTPAETYNNFGFCLLSILIVEAVIPVENPRRNSDYFGGLSSGAAVAACLFLKVSYAFVALFLLAALFFCRPQTPRRWTGIASGFLAVAIAVCAYLRFDLAAVFHDLRMVAGAKHLYPHWVHEVMANGGTREFVTLVPFTLVAATLVRQTRAEYARLILMVSVTLLLAGFVVMLSNSQGPLFPLDLVFAALVLHVLIRMWPAVEPRGRAALSSVGIWALILMTPGLVLQLLTLGYGAYETLRAPDAKSLFTGSRLAGFVDHDERLTAHFNDGLNLLAQNRQPGETIMALDWTNPFTFALGAKPAPGGTPALNFQATYDLTHYPPLGNLFGQADLVMVPQQSWPGGAGELRPIYLPYLETHFAEAANSAEWTLYRKR